MGIDIRNSGTDDADDGASDPNQSSGGWFVPGNSSIGGGHSSSTGQTNGHTIPVYGPGSPQWNQLLQNIQNAISSNGTAPSVGFTNNPKLNDMFAVDFLGFNFGSVNVNGTPNIDIMEDAAIAIGGMKRNRSGWEPFDMAFFDDEESDVARIMNRQMDEQVMHGDLFDMTVRYYDKLGNETSTLYLVDCEIVGIETDPLNMASQSPNSPLKVVASIQPKLVRYS